MYELGLRIKKLREQKGLTQIALARRINKSKSAIASYESGRQMPPLEVLISIAGVFGISLDYLAGFDKREHFCEGLDIEQREFVDMLFAELYMPSGRGESFSANQIEIIRNLILLFQKSNSI